MKRSEMIAKMVGVMRGHASLTNEDVNLLESIAFDVLHMMECEESMSPPYNHKVRRHPDYYTDSLVWDKE
jgi:hypothetical protein